MTGVSYPAAFLGGVFSLLSPCSSLLLPAFFAYSFPSTGRLVARTAVFYLGLCTTLVPLGALGPAATTLLGTHRELLTAVGGWALVALGVWQLTPWRPAPGRLRQAVGRVRSSSPPAVWALGAVYGLAGSCAGPILGAILTVAALGGDPVAGGGLLAIYALGMAAPLFVLALVWERARIPERGWLRGRQLRLGPVRVHSTTAAAGVMCVAVGAAMLVFDGGSGLPGLLDSGQEWRLNQLAGRLGSAVPAGAWAAGLAGLALAVVAYRLLRPPRDRGGSKSQATPSDGAAQAQLPGQQPADG